MSFVLSEFSVSSFSAAWMMKRNDRSSELKEQVWTQGKLLAEM